MEFVSVDEGQISQSELRYGRGRIQEKRRDEMRREEKSVGGTENNDEYALQLHYHTV